MGTDNTKKYRRWCATWNNFPENAFELVEKQVQLRFAICGVESAPSTGTVHLQCYFEYKIPKTMTTIKNQTGSSIHLEPARGSQQQNITYCGKEGKAIQFGTPASGKASGGDIRDMIQNGVSIKDIYNQDEFCNGPAIKLAETILKYEGGPKYIQREVIWIWGPSGTGKTHMACEATSDDVWISNGSLRWFQGYYGQAEAIFDDIRSSDVEYNMLLRLLDRYRLQVEIKGGSCPWLATKIFITCPHHPKKFLENGEDSGQLIRRITQIIEKHSF